MGAIEAAQRLGAATIGVSCTPESPLARTSLIAITPLVGPEVIAGSTRMKAGTATKLILNMLSTGAMIRLGNVYGNLMVNVQPRNEKLRDRARRIVRDATGLTDHEAPAALERAGNHVNTAIVMTRAGVSRARAEELLKEAEGRVGEALARAGAPET